MKRKGFTLIELLAVIVILAIIALIATPLVLKYIETARVNSKITSTQNYMKAVENSLASYSITNKGKSYPEGCHEISTLNTDLDISIKGDIPTEGTICIDNNKIDKAIVKYPDNKIIKYEDDKSTVSDEETYESFNSVSSYIIDVDAEFVYDGNVYTTTIPITKEIAEQFKEELDYDIIIDDDEKENLYFFDKYDSNFIFVSHATDISKMKQLLINDEEIMIAIEEELTGIHNVKIGNPRPVEEIVYFSVDSEGNIRIVGPDFIVADANVLIKDDAGTVYFNNTIELAEYYASDLIGADSDCRQNMTKLPEMFTALTNGKTITLEITQTIDGKEVVSKVSKNLNSMMNIGNNIYFSRYTSSLGC